MSIRMREKFSVLTAVGNSCNRAPPDCGTGWWRNWAGDSPPNIERVQRRRRKGAGHIRYGGERLVGDRTPDKFRCP